MPSWVAPSIAADFWRCSVDQILSFVIDGRIPSQVEGHFLFVNIQSDFPAAQANTPATYVSAQEFLALIGLEVSPIESREPQDASPEFAHESPDPIPEPESHDITQWRSARAQTSRLRKPPRAA